jgi:hypothetical protein
MSIHKKIHAWFGRLAGKPHARYRSWEHCYDFFRRTGRSGIARRADQAALQLAFYLASWGMYRGSSFTLKYAYTIHCGAVEALAEPRFAMLWKREIGAKSDDLDLVPTIVAARDAVRKTYDRFGWASDTLVTKILLGTVACLPACDQYFIRGFKRCGFKYSYLNEKFVERVLHFSCDNLADLRKEQAAIKRDSGVHYPLMKLVDMYFHVTGY